MRLTKIDMVTFPKTKGLAPDDAIDNMARVLKDALERLAHVNNELIDTEYRLQNLERAVEGISSEMRIR